MANERVSSRVLDHNDDREAKVEKYRRLLDSLAVYEGDNDAWDAGDRYGVYTIPPHWRGPIPVEKVQISYFSDSESPKYAYHMVWLNGEVGEEQNIINAYVYCAIEGNGTFTFNGEAGDVAERAACYILEWLQAAHAAGELVLMPTEPARYLPDSGHFPSV